MNLKTDYTEIDALIRKKLNLRENQKGIYIDIENLVVLIVELACRIHTMEENLAKMERNGIAVLRALEKRDIIDGVEFIQPDGTKVKAKSINEIKNLWKKEKNKYEP